MNSENENRVDVQFINDTGNLINSKLCIALCEIESISIVRPSLGKKISQ